MELIKENVDYEVTFYKKKTDGSILVEITMLEKKKHTKTKKPPPVERCGLTK